MSYRWCNPFWLGPSESDHVFPVRGKNGSWASVVFLIYNLLWLFNNFWRVPLDSCACKRPTLSLSLSVFPIWLLIWEIFCSLSFAPYSISLLTAAIRWQSICAAIPSFPCTCSTTRVSRSPSTIVAAFPQPLHNILPEFLSFCCYYNCCFLVTIATTPSHCFLTMALYCIPTACSNIHHPHCRIILHTHYSLFFFSFSSKFHLEEYPKVLVVLFLTQGVHRK